MKKSIVLFLLFTFLILFLTFCVIEGPGAAFPRHQCGSLEEVRTSMHMDIQTPDFLKNFDSSQYQVTYYYTAVPSPSGVVKTGYSVETKYVGQGNPAFKSMEFRGINLDKSGAETEGFQNQNYYTCTLQKSTVRDQEKELCYSAYNPRQYSAEEVASQKGLSSLPDVSNSKQNYFEYLYVYFMEDNIRYSITFSDFTSPPDESTAAFCLEQAKSYFANYSS